MKRLGRKERGVRERERERQKKSLDLALGPASDLFQTCFRPPQEDHLIFAKPCPESVAHALAPAKPHRSNLRRHVGATLVLLIADQRFRNSMLHKCLELRS